MYSFLSILFVAIMCVGCSNGYRAVSLPDTQGTKHVPLEAKGNEVVVLLFSSPDCPIANAIAPEIERLHQQTVAGGGRFYLVHARGNVTPDVATTHAGAFGITATVLLDHDQSLVEVMNATVTPELVVLAVAQDGTLQITYQGPINNLYASLGNRRDHATKHWGRDAIAKTIMGIPVDPQYREPIGCFLERSR
jgi:thiol-disulfide isomerase/thioredoxin